MNIHQHTHSVQHTAQQRKQKYDTDDDDEEIKKDDLIESLVKCYNEWMKINQHFCVMRVTFVETPTTSNNKQQLP